ncbi:MAG: ATP-binding cassette domain-containing protein [Coriobacteriia bacterium]|nr:ATP-binding cassette domain-containing protein [Coriobacteriia bacterium]
MTNWVKKASVVCLWILLWQLLAMLINNDILLASPLQTALTLCRGLVSPTFWSTINYSMLRILLGFVIALGAGLLAGAAAWRWPLLADLLNPAVTFIKSVPIVCFIVMLLIWFGSGWVAMVAVVLVAYPAIYFSVLEGLNQRDLQLNEMLEVFHVTGWRKLAAYYWPSILPFLQAACKTAVGMSWKSGVAAELIGLPMGSIGERIYRAKILLNSADVFAWTIVVVAISVVAELIFLRLLSHSDNWLWHLSLPKLYPGPTLPAAPTPITATDIKKQFVDKTVLANLSLTFEPGGRYAVFSPSGSGKTTLLRLLARLDSPDSGSITNTNRMSVVFQEARLFEKRNAVENIRLIVGSYVSDADIRSMLVCLLPADSLDLPTSQLSGGMRRRVELCRALLASSQVILLDEPFAGLDLANTAMAQELILSSLSGRTLVVVSHDPEDVELLSLKSLSLRA